MDSIHVEELIPRGNTAASRAGDGNSTAATSQMAEGSKETPFFAKPVLIIRKVGPGKVWAGYRIIQEESGLLFPCFVCKTYKEKKKSQQIKPS